MSRRGFTRTRRSNAAGRRLVTTAPSAARVVPSADRAPRVMAVIALGILALAAGPRVGASFTQGGASTVFGRVIPIGHEWITRLAALELLGGDPIMRPDPDDPRRNWKQGKAKDPDLSDAYAKLEVTRIRAGAAPDRQYESAYRSVFAAIIGQRWADIGGFNVTKSKLGPYDCHDAVTQQPAEIQYDHFMRRYDDRDAIGGINAARRSRDRFVEYFVDAAMAPATTMIAWDGGGASVAIQVDRNYFLLGRAVHLLQDSFSPEHTVRIADDNHERVLQVKSYLCAAGAEQHARSFAEIRNYTSGDVIWRPGTRVDTGWASHKPSNMKVLALVATEATKDLWAAFIRTMGRPLPQREAVARDEAARLAANWLRMDEAAAATWYDDESRRDATYVRAAGETGKGRTVAECMRALGVPSGDQLQRVREVERTQKICLYNITSAAGYSDLYDPSLHLWFNWAWRNQAKWEMPPNGWPIPDRPADTGVRVRIKSAANGQYMTAPDGIGNNSLVYCRGGAKPLDLILVGDQDEGYYRLADAANLFVSYTAATGAVKLYSSPGGSSYRLRRAGDGYSIQNLFRQQYMWLNRESPYVAPRGDPGKPNAQWFVEGLP
jgi:hypothetical protein